MSVNANPSLHVILSEAKNLSVLLTPKDSSVAPLPQNDREGNRDCHSTVCLAMTQGEGRMASGIMPLAMANKHPLLGPFGLGALVRLWINYPEF